MNFSKIAYQRQSCRKYDPDKTVEQEKTDAILEAVRLAPSACNGQPYFVTVCRGEKAKAVAKATMGMGMNAFAADAPVLMVISEMPYVKSAALGAKVKGNDYRSWYCRRVSDCRSHRTRPWHLYTRLVRRQKDT